MLVINIDFNLDRRHNFYSKYNKYAIISYALGGKFADVSPEMYRNVVIIMLLTLGLNTILNPIKYFVLEKIIKGFLRFYDRGFTNDYTRTRKTNN